VRIPESAIQQYRYTEQWYQASASAAAARPHAASYRMPDANALLGFAASAAERLGDVAARADAARAAALRARSGVFERMTAASSNPDAATAAATERAKPDAYDIVVERVAAAQRNAGRALPAEQRGGFAAGAHRLAIATAGRTTYAEARIDAADTNAAALGKLRDAIRASGAEARASVIRDAAGGTVRLQLTAPGTGSDYAFEVRDVAGSAAADSGIDAATEAAVDARYRVNGGEARTSSSNTVPLDNGRVLATLKRAGGEPVRLTVGPDASAAANAAKELAGAYNALLGSAAAASGALHPATARLVARLPADGLEDAGIRRLPDGALAVDEERLADALTSRYGETVRKLTGSGGLAGAIDRIAAAIAAAPTSALLHPNLRAAQAGLPLYAPRLGAYPAWLGMNGLLLDKTY